MCICLSRMLENAVSFLRGENNNMHRKSQKKNINAPLLHLLPETKRRTTATLDCVKPPEGPTKLFDYELQSPLMTVYLGMTYTQPCSPVGQKKNPPLLLFCVETENNKERFMIAKLKKEHCKDSSLVLLVSKVVV